MNEYPRVLFARLKPVNLMRKKSGNVGAALAAIPVLRASAFRGQGRAYKRRLMARESNLAPVFQ